MKSDSSVCTVAPTGLESVLSSPGLVLAETRFLEAVMRVWFDDACRRVRQNLEDAGFRLDDHITA